jgi:hypothetical protein
MAEKLDESAAQIHLTPIPPELLNPNEDNLSMDDAPMERNETIEFAISMGTPLIMSYADLFEEQVELAGKYIEEMDTTPERGFDYPDVV